MIGILFICVYMYIYIYIYVITLFFLIHIYYALLLDAVNHSWQRFRSDIFSSFPYVNQLCFAIAQLFLAFIYIAAPSASTHLVSYLCQYDKITKISALGKLSGWSRWLRNREDKLRDKHRLIKQSQYFNSNLQWAMDNSEINTDTFI